MSEQREQFSEWAIVELLGHRRFGALVSEQQLAGAAFLRLDVYGKPGGDQGGDRPLRTHLVNPTSVYCLTPVTEAMARAVAEGSMPQPVTRWELPAPRPPGPPDVLDEPYYDPELHRDDEDDDLDDLPL